MGAVLLEGACLWLARVLAYGGEVTCPCGESPHAHGDGLSVFLVAAVAGSVSPSLGGVRAVLVLQ